MRWKPAANQLTQQMAQMNPAGAAMTPDQDPDKLFLSEAENLEVVEHHSILEGIEGRVLAQLSTEVELLSPLHQTLFIRKLSFELPISSEQ
jgi:hypothetical protein